MIDQILHTFATHPGEYISGGMLSEKLNCSRTAIWKHIETLRKQGYTIEAVPSRGYRLLQQPEVMDVAHIEASLRTEVFGRHIIYEREVDSTQNLAHMHVRQGAEEGTIILTDEQTEGRGTRGKSWHSPSGKGIWFSMILKPNMPAQYISQLTLLTAVALCRTISQSLAIHIGVKWPNDLLVDGKKVSGILLESSSEDDRLRYVIAGVGISANLEVDDFPPELRDKATSLLILGEKRIDRERLLCDFLLEFEKLYELYTTSGFTPIKTLWEALSVTLNRQVTVQSVRGLISGLAVGLDDSGALLVEEDGGHILKIYSGDVLLAH